MVMIDREDRQDIEKMIDDKVNQSNDLFILRFEKIDTKLDIFNTNIINYISSQEVMKKEVKELQHNNLTREINCPFRSTIQQNNNYIAESKAVKKYVLRLIALSSTLITLLNALLIYYM